MFQKLTALRAKHLGIALLCRSLVGLAILAGPVEWAAAQGRRKEQPVIEVTRFSGLKGQVVGVQPGMIQWSDGGEVPLYAKILPTTVVQVVGTAEPEFLRPGMFVRFTGEIEGRGTLREPVAELTIFTPRQGYVVGVFNDGDDPTRTDGPKLIAGAIKSFKAGKLTVQADNVQIKATLADDVSIKLDVDDYSGASAGDEITVSGLGFEQDKIEAQTIEIQLAEPLAGAKKKRPRAAKHDAKAAPAP